MQMHLTIAIFFLITVLIALFEERLKDSHKIIILAGYVLFMVFLATTKSIDHTADASAYELYFYKNDNPLIEIMTEPTFIYLSRLVLSLGGTIVTMFFIYACISIPLKIVCISKMTPHVFTALLIYIPIYFELQDMIQIRAAAAATFGLASLIPLAKKQYIIATILIIMGTLFHYSAAVYLLLLFIGNMKLSKRWRVSIATILPFFIILSLLKKDLLSFVPSFLMYGKVGFYKEGTEGGAWGGSFSPYYMLYVFIKCIVLYAILYYYNLIISKNRYATILINAFTVSILIVFSLSTIPILAGRLSELFGIVDCIVFTFILYIVVPPYIAKLSVVFTGIYMILYAILFTEYFT